MSTDLQIPLTFSKDNVKSEDEYFLDYADLEVHRLMVKDKVRMETYRNAIMKNKHLFEGKIVMDVGAGTGILSLFMASAGAKKVYAVEASNLAKIIPQVAKDNNFGGVIQTLHSKVEDVILPEKEKIDVIVSEWMGFYLLHESMLTSVIYARDKFLSEEGTMFPSEARIYACPCTLENLYSTQFYFWENVWGYNMSAIKDLSFKSKQIKPEICVIKSSELLSDPICIKTFNLRYVTVNDFTNFSCTNFVALTKTGKYQGLALWFECDFDGRDYDTEGKEFGKLFTLSTSPLHEPTHWKQTVIMLGSIRRSTSNSEEEAIAIPLTNDESSSLKVSTLESRSSSVMDWENDSDNEDEQLVEEDEVVGWQLNFSNSQRNCRHYNITFEMLDPESAEHPIPCSCPMPRCMIIKKMIENEELEQTNADSVPEGS